MQSQQIPPDVTFGFGTEVEESGGSFVNLGWPGFALVLAVVGYLVWRKTKGKKR